MNKAFINKIRKNKYLYFLLKLFILFVILVALDFTIGNVLNYFYFRQESGMQFRTTYSIEKTRADVLIFGSSRANHHYEPDSFEKRLNLSFYNSGRDGNFIFYNYAVLKGVLKRYRPQIIILDFTRGEFNRRQESYDRISSLLPYYRTHPEIRPIIELKSPYEKLKLLSFIYPFNSSILTIAIGNTEYNKRRWEDNMGYVPLTMLNNKSILADSTNWTPELDRVKVKVFESFIRDCTKSRVKLYIICSPYFIRFIKNDNSIILGESIAKKYGVAFYDFSNDTTLTNKPKLFADRDHLNDVGAKVFCNILLDSITNERQKTSISKKK